MARSVPYDRQTVRHPNPLARLAHRSRYARSLALVSRFAAPGATVLDFGAGTGALLTRLHEERPDLTLIGYEPFKQVADESLDMRPTLDGLPDGSVDLLCAFEVLEHLEPDVLDSFVAEALRLGRLGGHVLISVPIVEGLALPMKVASHAMLFRDMSGYAPSEIAAGLFGRPVQRTGQRFWSHKGFSHRALLLRLSTSFVLRGTLHSPFTGLPWWVNSQAFWVLSARTAS